MGLAKSARANLGILYTCSSNVPPNISHAVIVQDKLCFQPGTDKGALSCNDLLCHRVDRFCQAGSMIDPASATTCRDVSAVLVAPFGSKDARIATGQRSPQNP